MYLADRGSSRALENVSDFADQQLEDVFEEEDADDCSRVAHEGAVHAGALHVTQRVFALVVSGHGFEASDAPLGDRLLAVSPVAYRTSLRCTYPTMEPSSPAIGKRE